MNHLKVRMAWHFAYYDPVWLNLNERFVLFSTSTFVFIRIRANTFSQAYFGKQNRSDVCMRKPLWMNLMQPTSQIPAQATTGGTQGKFHIPYLVEQLAAL